MLAHTSWQHVGASPWTDVGHGELSHPAAMLSHSPQAIPLRQQARSAVGMCACLRALHDDTTVLRNQINCLFGRSSIGDIMHGIILCARLSLGHINENVLFEPCLSGISRLNIAPGDACAHIHDLFFLPSATAAVCLQNTRCTSCSGGKDVRFAHMMG